ncbi:hypothetical protein BU15DRAFT_69014 [Melanogaster broomeanus]|nr:hypothetical protein BU15DRAFT_69014 [Melanogaster broomeanus]
MSHPLPLTTVAGYGWGDLAGGCVGSPTFCVKLRCVTGSETAICMNKSSLITMEKGYHNFPPPIPYGLRKRLQRGINTIRPRWFPLDVREHWPCAHLRVKLTILQLRILRQKQDALFLAAVEIRTLAKSSPGGLAFLRPPAICTLNVSSHLAAMTEEVGNLALEVPVNGSEERVIPPSPASARYTLHQACKARISQTYRL